MYLRVKLVVSSKFIAFKTSKFYTCIGTLLFSAISLTTLDDTAVDAYRWLLLIFIAGPLVELKINQLN